MDSMTIVVVSFIIAAGGAFLAGALLLRWWPAVRLERLKVPAPESASILRWEDQARTAWQRILERLGRAGGPRDGAMQSKYRQRLFWAGYHDPRAVTFFIGAKVGLAIFSGYAYTLYGLAVQRALPNVLPVSIMLASLGFFLPDFWLRNRVRVRQREVVNALPDVLDLLVVCVEAGMGFDAAIARIAGQPEARQSPLHQELLRMHFEVRAGRRREEALRALGERTGVQEVKAVVGALIQTDRMGSPLGKTLRVHSESARVQRRYRAEERAHLAPLKMIFPTVLFLMPSFFVVAMAPPLLSLLNVFRSLGK